MVITMIEEMMEIKMNLILMHSSTIFPTTMEDIFPNTETLLEKLYLIFGVWFLPPNSRFKLPILVKKIVVPPFLHKHLCKGDTPP